MRYVTFLALVAAASLASAQDHFRFVVTGDGRWETSTPRSGDDTGVNVAGMTRLVKSILQDKPEVMLFTGDTVGGTKLDVDEAKQYATWIKVMKPLYDSGIHMLVIRGNHEMHCEHPDELWRKVFSGEFANPQNGPDSEKDLTYSFTYGNTLFLGLDQFQTKQCVINQDWLDKTLAANPKTHVFAFAHKMAFRGGHHDDGMETVPDARDKFFDSLANAGSRAYFCGHDHLYDHTAIARPDWPESKSIHQFIVGTAGAPFYHGDDHNGQNEDWKLKELAHNEGHLGYCVVDIDGAKATFSYKAETDPGVFKVVDTWSYTAEQGTRAKASSK